MFTPNCPLNARKIWIVAQIVFGFACAAQSHFIMDYRDSNLFDLEFPDVFVHLAGCFDGSSSYILYIHLCVLSLGLWTKRYETQQDDAILRREIYQTCFDGPICLKNVVQAQTTFVSFAACGFLFGSLG